MIRWDDLVPALLVANIAVVAPLSESDSPTTPPFVVRPQFYPWIYDSTYYDGQFRLCNEAPALVCSIAFGDDF